MYSARRGRPARVRLQPRRLHERRGEGARERERGQPHAALAERTLAALHRGRVRREEGHELGLRGRGPAGDLRDRGADVETEFGVGELGQFALRLKDQYDMLPLGSCSCEKPDPFAAACYGYVSVSICFGLCFRYVF